MSRTLVAIGFLAAAGALAQGPASDLERGFQNPPDSARPRAWWHWMNGNVTKEGITADLEWMKRVGIAGMQMFDGDMGVPQFTGKRLVWMTPDWKDAFRHAAAEADRLGLEMSMAASGGWSETAGPWVKPAEAMKKVVWSETAVEGPKTFRGVLPHPPSVNGRFQDIPAPPDQPVPDAPNLPGAKPRAKTQQPTPDPTYYADIAVLAYRLPDGEVRMADLHPKLTSSASGLDTAALVDGDVATGIRLPAGDGANKAWIQFEFALPFRTQAFSIAAGDATTWGGASIPEGEVQVSQDGSLWRTLLSLPGPGHAFGGFPVRTYSYDPVTARFYRVLFDPPKPAQFADLFPSPPVRAFKVAEVEFHSTPRVNHWQEKAAFGNMMEFDSVAGPPLPVEQTPSRGQVIDITSKMQPDGSLEWDAPPGRWIVLRMGCSLTGEKNHPATPEATGFEVDKLNRAHVESYVKTYADMVSDALGPYFGKSFRYFLMDSWEANMENWTGDLRDQFRNRRGYDLTPFLPALAGRVVGSVDATNRFLWDYRRTLADLLAENHYGAATEYFHKRGVGLAAEAMGAGLPATGDGLQNKGRVDIPMGEFWTPLPGQKDSAEHPADVREAASAAHIYGKPIAATESFTTMFFVPGWAQSPFYLKPLADQNFARGVNRIVFHTSVHQPFVDDAHKPGLTLWMFGQHYTRNNTWAEQAVAWNTYIARCSYLLQQGLYVGDIAYFYGEGAPATVPFWKELQPAPPAGYSYDYLNADVLLTRLSVKDGRLTLPDGMTYRALVLPEDVDQMTVPVARKIRDLVAAGATLVAPRPVKSPSLADYPAADDEIRFIANEVWGPIDGKSVTEHVYGQGRVVWGQSLEQVLAADKVPPDFESNRPRSDSELVWIHRRTADADIYFVANQRERAESFETSYRVEGKEAELWHAGTGVIEPAAYRIEKGHTVVPLDLDPDGSVFVVFRRVAAAPSRTLPQPVTTALATIEGPWQVSFPPNWGAPPEAEFPKLESWTASADEGVKYFSGTATYTRSVDAPQDWFRPGARLVLDLGTVKEIAEVAVNGKPVGGVLWKPPYRVDVTNMLAPGPNRIEVRVTNLWPNRMIGDRQPGAKRYTFTDYWPYRKDSKLLESGLLGPVTVSALVTK